MERLWAHLGDIAVVYVGMAVGEDCGDIDVFGQEDMF